MTTANDEMRTLLGDLKVPAKKAEAIMERFAQLIADVQTPAVVFVSGSRPAVEHVECYGLRIGVDACGNAATVESTLISTGYGFDVTELGYDA